MKKAFPAFCPRACGALFALALLPHAAGAQNQTAPHASNGSTQATSSQSQGSSGQAGNQAAGRAGTPAVNFLLVPVLPAAQDPVLKGGCWAKLHDNQNFTGDVLTLSGPIDMPNMVGPFGIDWQGKVSSIETGPKTTLTIYDNENYRDPVSTFKPGARVGDVSKRMGFFDQMRSLKITCAK